MIMPLGHERLRLPTKPSVIVWSLLVALLLRMAMVLAGLHSARSLLGSATPCMESLYNARSGKYGFAALRVRYGHANLPKIEKVDLAEMQKKRKMRGSFSEPLVAALQQALGRKEQAIIFRNRRGTSLKILAYDGQGFFYAQKRLSQGTFRNWPTSDTVPAYALHPHQAHVLLAAGNPAVKAAPVWRAVAPPSTQVPA